MRRGCSSGTRAIWSTGVRQLPHCPAIMATCGRPISASTGAATTFTFQPTDSLRVVHAGHPLGPWSEPIDLGIVSIDPAHIAEKERRFLYMADGRPAELTADGLAVKTPPRKVFDAWPMPSSIRMECTCLEGPKLLEHNGYFYLNVAEGGTAGPGTSHSVVSARSRHADGPWEFSPTIPWFIPAPGRRPLALVGPWPLWSIRPMGDGS